MKFLLSFNSTLYSKPVSLSHTSIPHLQTISSNLKMAKLSVLLLASVLTIITAIPVAHEAHGVKARANIYPNIKYAGDTESKRDVEARTNMYPNIKYEGETDTDAKRDVEARTNIYPHIKYEGGTDTDAKRDIETSINIYPNIKYAGDTDE